MYKCEICQRKYESVSDYATCVSKCSEELKKKEEAKRLEEANAALNKVKQAKAYYQEQLDNFKKKYPTEYKMYLFNNDGVNECPYDCKGFVVNEKDIKPETVELTYKDNGKDKPKMAAKVNGKDVPTETLFSDPDVKYLAKLLGILD